jgi:hypothetical protein
MTTLVFNRPVVDANLGDCPPIPDVLRLGLDREVLRWYRQVFPPFIAVNRR